MSTTLVTNQSPITFHFETARLVLRAFEDRDIEPFHLYRSDAEVAKYQGWEAPYSLEQAAQFISEMKNQTPGKPGEWFQIALELKTSAEMIGDCGFVILTEDTRQAEIGFTLARSFQGHGYAAEAVTCLLDYLFGDLDLHRVRANCDPNNHSSAKLMRNIGMRYEGRFVESLWFKGSWVNEDWYAILEREWAERRLD
jgi:RimJ/RimL family protein N-acetyltransferase